MKNDNYCADCQYCNIGENDMCYHCQHGDDMKVTTLGKFEKAGRTLGSLVDKKQAQYGDMITSMGPILKELFPTGVKVEQYSDLALIVRILDKLGRISKGNGEGDEDAWMDIAGYGLLGSKKGGYNLENIQWNVLSDDR